MEAENSTPNPSTMEGRNLGGGCAPTTPGHETLSRRVPIARYARRTRPRGIYRRKIHDHPGQTFFSFFESPEKFPELDTSLRQWSMPGSSIGCYGVKEITDRVLNSPFMRKIPPALAPPPPVPGSN